MKEIDEENTLGLCPICDEMFPLNVIEKHVDKCIFLNSSTDETNKRKRTPSPSYVGNGNMGTAHSKMVCTQISPKDNGTVLKQNFKSPCNVAPIFQINKAGSSKSDVEIPIIKLEGNGEVNSISFNIPLAKQVAPKSLDDFFGQNHVLGKNTVLRSLLEKGEIPNMILWGPPGCGKTSLSGVICEICKLNPKILKFVSLCAATCGVKDVQSIITAAKNEMKFGRKTILFMDEIHRFNKKQQDTFLLSVEKGEITLIGATTENPSFSLNSALLSRCRVIVMEKLEPDDMYSILEKAAESLLVDVVDTENPCGVIDDPNGVAIESSALKWLADISDGDARIALGNLQMTLQHCYQNGKIITIEDIREGIKKSHMLYDRKGEEHYNIISAMHKSIRGSDANAALYWTARMIVSGEDPLFIARRLVRAASEDIGNRDPNALQLAVATMQGCQLLGMPEADCLLAQCAIYLARAPKSREADTALGKAKKMISEWKGPQPSVPLHIRNAPTKLMKDLGYAQRKPGEHYSFMPPEMEHINFFKE